MTAIKTKFKADFSQTKKMLSVQSSGFKELPEFAYKEFVKNTPRRSGNARRNTELQDDKIIANYAYAGRLEDGASRQAPDGMIQPTIDAVEQEFKKISGRK